MTFARTFTRLLVAAALVAAATFVMGPSARAAGPFTVYLPNITKTLGGADGWHTPFIVQNVGSVATNITVTFFKFSDGSLVTTRKAVVLPGRSFVDSPRDDPDLADNLQYSVVITSSDSPVVALVNEHHGFDAGDEALSYSGISQGSTQVFLPLVYKQFDSWLTTLIIQNVGAESAQVTATFVSLDAKIRATITRTIAPGRSQFIDPRTEPSLVAGTIYTAAVSAPEPIAVVSNHHHDLPGVTPAMGDSYNAVPGGPGNTTAYVPYVAKHTNGADPSSQLFIENVGNGNNVPTLTFTRFGGTFTGTEPVPFTGPMLAPGTGYKLDPPIPDGDYSLAITGGTFAAAVTTQTQMTAMIYTSTTTPQTKLFLPNVTRTLGPPGDPGWTTPIYIQSATATNATLRWFRFADGALVTTQTVALTAGMTTLIDPRNVKELSDNTQYAVIVESDTGAFVVIVTEINPIAVVGDNAMVYKGFPAP